MSGVLMGFGSPAVVVNAVILAARWSTCVPVSVGLVAAGLVALFWALYLRLGALDR